MLDELLTLSQTLQRCHTAAKEAGDTDLADALHEMGWTTMKLIFQRMRNEALERAS